MKLGRIVKPASPKFYDFVACGENSLDTIGVGPGLLPAAGKHRLHSLVELPGGQAATAAIACARLGWRTRYVGTIGDDPAGQIVRSRLDADGVDAQLTVRHAVSTRRAIVIVDDATGERTVLERRDARLDFRPGEVPAEIFSTARVVLVDGSDIEQSIRAAEAARLEGVRTLLDLDHHSDRAHQLMALIDVIVLPEPVVSPLAGVPGLGRALEVIGVESGAGAVVATLGPRGALGWCRAGEVRSPPQDASVVDSTGAGDAFRAGFAAAWLGAAGTDPDLEALLAGANLVAALSCRTVGAQEGLPQRWEVPGGLRGGV